MRENKWPPTLLGVIEIVCEEDVDPKRVHFVSACWRGPVTMEVEIHYWHESTPGHWVSRSRTRDVHRVVS